MRPIKNKRKIDPRYFLHETTYRDELEEQLPPHDITGPTEGLRRDMYEGSKSEDSGSKPYKAPDKAPSVPGKPDPGTQPDKPFPKTPESGTKGPLSESLSSRYGHHDSKKPTKKRQLSKNTKYKYKLNK